jgi:excisionase family DNA binding protein
MHESADYLGVSYKYLSSHYREWELPATRVGKYVRFMVRHLDAFLEERTDKPQTELGKWLREQREAQ